MIKIISGGQTGVDRAALDVALNYEVDCGGWCPEGREAEDGAISGKYPVQVLSGAGYRQRTKKNVIDSDGTLVIYFGYPSGGTEQTIAFCIKERKPYILIDAEEIAIEKAAGKVMSFIKDKSIISLNVAGPRASGESRAYEYTKSLLTTVIKKLN